MRKAERAKWQGVVALKGAQCEQELGVQAPLDERLLCGWCKFVGDDTDYDDYQDRVRHYAICEHPLTIVREWGPLSDDYPDLTDCWGFRPARRWIDVADELSTTVEQAEQEFVAISHAALATDHVC